MQQALRRWFKGRFRGDGAEPHSTAPPAEAAPARDATGPAVGEPLWIDRPDAERIARERTSDETLLAHFREMRDLGFTIVRDAIPESLCDAAIADYERWCEQAGEVAAAVRNAEGHHPRLVNFHTASANVQSLFTRNTRALEIQDFCFGYRTSIYTSLFYQIGTEQPVHRDVPYFRSEPESFYFGMWIALEDVHEDNGCLMVVPKGHRLPPIDPREIKREILGAAEDVPAVSQELFQAYQAAVKRECEALELETTLVPIHKGDTILWHPMTPHGGSPVVDRQATRYSIVFHTVPVGVPVYQGDYFFNPDRVAPRECRWGFQSADDRLYADLGQPHFQG